MKSPSEAIAELTRHSEHESPTASQTASSKESNEEPLTTLDDLQRQIGLLACVDQTHAFFVSCYLNLEQGETGYRKVLEDRAHAVRKTLDGEARSDFDAAIDQIRDYLTAVRTLNAQNAIIG